MNGKNTLAAAITSAVSVNSKRIGASIRPMPKSVWFTTPLDRNRIDHAKALTITPTDSGSTIATRISVWTAPRARASAKAVG